MSLLVRFFALDLPVARHLVSIKLVGKSRRDLDDISSKTFVPLASCRRQFDNVFALARMIEDASDDLFVTLKRKTMLPLWLITKYVAILFLNHHQIQLESEFLEPLSVEQVIKLTLIIIKSWGLGKSSFLIDPTFSQDLRDLKTLFITVVDDFRDVMVQKVNGHPEEIKRRILNTLKETVLAMLSIGCSLGSPRDVRNIFVDLLLKICIPLSSIRQYFEIPEVFLMVSSFFKCACQSKTINPRVLVTMTKFFDGLSLLVSECSSL